MEVNPGPPSNSSSWIWPLRSYPYTVGAILMVAGMAVPFLTVERDWETCLLVEARRLWAGETIYGHHDLYPYAPFPTLVALPFAYLPSGISNLLFYALNMACLFFMIRWSWQLAGGGPLQGRAPVARQEHVIMLLGLSCGILFAWNCLSHHQTDLLIGAAMIGGCVALARSRTFLAATCFGVAAAMKGPALLWAPYLLWRGRWKEALWVGVVFIAINILPTAVVPTQHDRFLFGEWAQRFLRPMGESADYPFFWYTESNQSLVGGAYRWFTTTWSWNDGFQQRLPIADPASPADLRMFLLTCGAVLVLCTMLFQGRRRLPRAGESDGHLRLALECSTVFLLMLLFSPMSGKAHFGTMLVPGFTLARLMVQKGSPVLAAVLAIALLGILSSQNFMGDYFVCVVMWYGVVTWSALVLLVGCWYGLAALVESRRANPQGRSELGASPGRRAA
jgi:Glycosyltransferase family 87